MTHFVKPGTQGRGEIEGDARFIFLQKCSLISYRFTLHQGLPNKITDNPPFQRNRDVRFRNTSQCWFRYSKLGGATNRSRFIHKGNAFTFCDDTAMAQKSIETALQCSPVESD